MIDPAYLHWIGSVPLGSLIATFGIFGNIFSIIVWRRLIKGKLRDNQSTGIYLITLAVCDTGVCIFFLLADTVKIDNPKLIEDYVYATFFAWFGFPVFYFFVVASIWMVVCVTLSRYVMMQFPIKVRIIYSGWRTYAIMGVFLGFSFVINIPHFFNFHVPLENGTYSLKLTDYGKTRGSQMYEFWAHCIFLVLAPWVSIVILNGLIVFKLSKEMKKFEKLKDCNKEISGKKERQEIEMTKMLLSVTFTFLLFLLWQCVTQCFYMLGFNKDKQAISMSWHYVDSSQAFAKLGVVLNSSVNWFLYCVSGSTFRKEMKVWFVKMFGRVVDFSAISDSSLSSGGVTLKSDLTSSGGQINAMYVKDEAV